MDGWPSVGWCWTVDVKFNLWLFSLVVNGCIGSGWWVNHDGL